MSERAKHSVQARCEDIGLVMRAAFWLYGVYVLILLGLGIWMLAQSADQFSMHVTQTQNGLLGQAFFRNTLEIDFTRASLNTDAVRLFYGMDCQSFILRYFVSGAQNFSQYRRKTNTICC